MAFHQIEYRLPLIHCLLACLGFLILGFGLGTSYNFFSAKKVPVNTAIVTIITPTPTSTIAPTPTPLNIIPEKGMMVISLYFDNINFNPNVNDCAAVFPIKRQIPSTTAVAKATLEQLFAGPTEEEKVLGFRSIFSSDTAKIMQYVSIKDKAVYINFNKTAFLKAIEAGANSSCGSAQYSASLSKTLYAIPGISSILPNSLSLNGSVSDYISLMQQ